MTKIRRTKNFSTPKWRSEDSSAGYTKPVRDHSDHRRLFFFSHMTNSIRVLLALCVAYTYLRKLIFVGVLSDENITWQKFNRRKFLDLKPLRMDFNKQAQKCQVVKPFFLGLVPRPSHCPVFWSLVVCKNEGGKAWSILSHEWCQCLPR